MEPKNMLYYTQHDFEMWQEFFRRIFPQKDTTVSSIDLVKTITFVVTERCNLRCTYCYEDHYYHECGKRMTKEVAKQAIDMFFEEEKIKGYIDTNETQGVILDFIGGEPLLEIELIDYAVDYFKIKAFSVNHPWAYHYCISMSTNGLLYFNPKVQRFIEKNKGKISMNISIDGNKELHDACRLLPNGAGSYDLVEKAVLHNVMHRGAETTKLTLAPENLDYMVDAFKHCWTNLHIKAIYSNCVYEDVWCLEDAKKLFKNLIEIADYIIDNNYENKYYTSLFDEVVGSKLQDDVNYCGGNGDMLAIGPDGICYPCLRFMEHSMKSKRKPLTCGSIYEGLEDKATSPTLCDLCSVTMSSQSPQKCLDCTIQSGCGLCTGYNYDAFGTPNKRATNICDMHHVRVIANAYYWNKLYKKHKRDMSFNLNLTKEQCLKFMSEKEYNKIMEVL